MRAPIGESRITGYDKGKEEVVIEYRKRDTSGNKTKEMDKEKMGVLGYILQPQKEITGIFYFDRCVYSGV